MTCPSCETTFERTGRLARYKGAPSTFCSRSCAGKARAKRTNDARLHVQGPPAPKPCARCEANLSPSSPRRYCPDGCAAEAARDAYDKRNSLARGVRACRECRTPFERSYGHKSKRFCSRVCSRRHQGRIGKAQRRARVRALPREPINPIEIFERDAWRCHLCGDEAPACLRGTTHPLAPELDHIEPIAKGGSHTPGNVACAHRKCNQRKRDSRVAIFPCGWPQDCPVSQACARPKSAASSPITAEA